MSPRVKTLVEYLLARMGEPSTWQGIGFLVGLLGAKWAGNMDWGGAAALGGFISAMIKTTFPDKV